MNEPTSGSSDEDVKFGGHDSGRKGWLSLRFVGFSVRFKFTRSEVRLKVIVSGYPH